MASEVPARAASSAWSLRRAPQATPSDGDRRGVQIAVAAREYRISLRSRGSRWFPDGASGLRSAAMEFGLFIGGWVPDYLDGRNDAAEHERLVNETRIAEAGDRTNWKYVWVTEHHFLAEYTHISANEVVMPHILARTERIRVASGIINVTPPVNHPARIAERVAMLDHLSGGRFDFGTGRGSSTTEQAGFGITDPDLTKEMFDEVMPEFRKMWGQDTYSFDGRFFSMPERNVLPKPYVKPHPPMWVAAGNPDTFEKAAKLGLGVICFTGGSPEKMQPLVDDLQGAHRRRRAGRRLRQRQRRHHHQLHVPRGRRRRPRLDDPLAQRPPAEPGVQVPRHLPEAARASPSGPRRSPTRPSSSSPSAPRRAPRSSARPTSAPRSSRSGRPSASTS